MVQVYKAVFGEEGKEIYIAIDREHGRMYDEYVSEKTAEWSKPGFNPPYWNECAFDEGRLDGAKLLEPESEK